MPDGGKMICEDCGVEMNLHAEKVDYGADAAAGETLDPEFGGALEEFHTCPDCGATQARPAA